MFPFLLPAIIGLGGIIGAVLENQNNEREYQRQLALERRRFWYGVILTIVNAAITISLIEITNNIF
ncbi:MAG: hypothetical protein ACFBSE_21440 [Prochloraceae cyanobacterium]